MKSSGTKTAAQLQKTTQQAPKPSPDSAQRTAQRILEGRNNQTERK